MAMRQQRTRPDTQGDQGAARTTRDAASQLCSSEDDAELISPNPEKTRE
jgi:hypothetical protein